MVLGFIFGRVVIARAYIKGVGTLAKPAEPPAPRDETTGAANTVFTPSSDEGTTAPEQGGDAAQTVTPSSLEEPQPENAAPETATPVEEEAPPEVQEAPAAEAPSGDVRYVVQVGLFGSEGSARDTLHQLTRSGHPSRIEVDRQSSRTMYRVLSGSYRNEANARKALDEIKGEGFAEAFVVTR